MIIPMYAEWVFMLAAAAIAARATRLATRDTITAPTRQWIGKRFDHTQPGTEPGPAETFASCAWCIGWWITLTTYTATYAIWPGHNWSAPQILAWLSAACITNIVYASTASATAKLRDISDAAELHLYSNRGESL